jgi:RNA polymerase sigma-70 factor (ECF subfamily)
MSNQETEGESVTALSDNILLERAGRGDEASFETLFYRHYDRIYGLLFRLLGNRTEAEDVTQEVFLKLYRQPLRGRREHNVGGWLYRVATNMGYNYLRSARRRRGRDTRLVPDATDEPVRPADRVIQEETRAVVRAALAKLPQRQTQMLLLRQMGLSYSELAAACDVAPGSVGTMLSRAAQAFREVYEEETGDRS